MIYRLKAPTRKDIKEQIPFELYREDEQGNKQPVFATENYSYHFIGHEWEVAPKYNEDGELTNDPVLSDYVLADFSVYDDTEITFSDPVEELDPITPMHGWK